MKIYTMAQSTIRLRHQDLTYLYHFCNNRTTMPANLASSPNVSRILIFTLTKNAAEVLRFALQSSTSSLTSTLPFTSVAVLLYHATLSDEAKRTAHSNWTNSSPSRSPPSTSLLNIMVCTSSFGTGVDSDNVTLLFNVGGTPSLSDLAQEAGRSGRGQAQATCITIYCSSYFNTVRRQLSNFTPAVNHEILANHHSTVRPEQWIEIQRWMQDTSHCRRNFLYYKIDGVEPGICLFDSNTSNCDVCELQTSAPNSSATPAGSSTQSQQPSTGPSHSLDGKRHGKDAETPIQTKKHKRLPLPLNTVQPGSKQTHHVVHTHTPPPRFYLLPSPRVVPPRQGPSFPPPLRGPKHFAHETLPPDSTPHSDALPTSLDVFDGYTIVKKMEEIARTLSPFCAICFQAFQIRPQRDHRNCTVQSNRCFKCLSVSPHTCPMFCRKYIYSSKK